jgi:hypothetical protein
MQKYFAKSNKLIYKILCAWYNSWVYYEAEISQMKTRSGRILGDTFNTFGSSIAIQEEVSYSINI